MSCESNRLESPTDAIVAAMEQAHEIETVIVIYRKLDGSAGYFSNTGNVAIHAGMCDIHKATMMFQLLLKAKGGAA